MSNVHLFIFAGIVLGLLALLYNEVRLRERDEQTIKRLESHLNACHANNAKLCRDKAALELELRSSRHAYIVDLPTHIPNVRIYEN